MSGGSKQQMCCMTDGDPMASGYGSTEQGAHGDLRLLLGQLQMVRLSAAALQYDDVKRQALNAKVSTFSGWDVSHAMTPLDAMDSLHACESLIVLAHNRDEPARLSTSSVNTRIVSVHGLEYIEFYDRLVVLMQSSRPFKAFNVCCVSQHRTLT